MLSECEQCEQATKRLRILQDKTTLNRVSKNLKEEFRYPDSYNAYLLNVNVKDNLQSATASILQFQYNISPMRRDY